MQAGEESTCELVDEEGLPNKADAEQISADEKQVKQIAFCSLLRRCSETFVTFVFEGFGWEANFWPPPFLILHSEQATRPLIWNIGNLHICIIPSVLVTLTWKFREHREAFLVHTIISRDIPAACSVLKASDKVGALVAAVGA